MREVWNPGWAPVTPFAKCWPLSGNSQNVRLSMQKDLCILRLEEWSKGVKHWNYMFWTPPQPTSGKAWLLSPKQNGGSRHVDGPFSFWRFMPIRSDWASIIPSVMSRSSAEPRRVSGVRRYFRHIRVSWLVWGFLENNFECVTPSVHFASHRIHSPVVLRIHVNIFRSLQGGVGGSQHFVEDHNLNSEPSIIDSRRDVQ